MNEIQGLGTQGTQGWVCPKCGQVNAPFITKCSCAVEVQSKTIVSSSTNENQAKKNWIKD